MAGCPSCDRDLSAPGQNGHECYTYAEHTAKQLAKQGESNAPRTFASPLTRVSGRQAGPHSDAAHRAITAELVACTLGVRDRPELLVP